MESAVIQQRVPVSSDPGHWIHITDSPRNVRVIFAGGTIADSKAVKLLRESNVLPVYYFPKKDIRFDRMRASDHRTQCQYKGEAVYWSLQNGNNSAENAVWSYTNPLPAAEALTDYFAFEWNKMDGWFEEDEEIYVHPRDPFKRVDALPSKRHVRVVIDGQTVADTRRPQWDPLESTCRHASLSIL